MGELITLPAAGARRVPTFNADNERIRSYSEDRVNNLVALGRMSAMVNRDGKILWAKFIHHDAPPRPISKARYKLIQVPTQLPGIEACAAIFAVPLDLAQADLALYQRAVFQQVLLSVRHLDKPQRPKVVSIDSKRKANSRQRSAISERIAA